MGALVLETTVIGVWPMLEGCVCPWPIESVEREGMVGNVGMVGIGGRLLDDGAPASSSDFSSFSLPGTGGNMPANASI